MILTPLVNPVEDLMCFTNPYILFIPIAFLLYQYLDGFPEIELFYHYYVQI